MSLVMSRLRALEEPRSRLAVWAMRIAAFSLAVAALAIIIERADLLEIMPVLITFGAALALALLALLLAFASFVALWNNGGSGFAQAMMAVLISVVLLGYPGYLAYMGYQLPAIKDITTDPIDPPRFEVVARLRPPNSNPYPGLAAAGLQKEAWPDIEPLLLNVSAKVAFDGTMAVITKRKWRIVDARAPLPIAKDTSRLSRVRRSWVSAMMWWYASARRARARKSTSVLRRALAPLISAPTQHACSRCSTISTMLRRPKKPTDKSARTSRP